MKYFFNLNWAAKCDTREEVIDRVYQLEANPYLSFEKEIKLMEREIESGKPNLQILFLNDEKQLMEKKENFPFLLVDLNNLKSEFKSAPSFADRMGDLRLMYYHLYRFTSMLTHPSKIERIFYV